MQSQQGSHHRPLRDPTGRVAQMAGRATRPQQPATSVRQYATTQKQQPAASSRRMPNSEHAPKLHASQLAQQAAMHREAEAEEETVRAAVERRSDYARQQQAQAELVETKMRLLMSNASEDPNALNHTIANAIAAKQSGGAVHSLMTTGYGYE